VRSRAFPSTNKSAIRSECRFYLAFVPAVSFFHIDQSLLELKVSRDLLSKAIKEGKKGQLKLEQDFQLSQKLGPRDTRVVFFQDLSAP
jgi:hypothetical protein